MRTVGVSPGPDRDPTPAVIIDPVLGSWGVRDDETLIVDALEDPQAPDRRVERYVIGGFVVLLLAIVAFVAIGSRNAASSAPHGVAATWSPAPATVSPTTIESRVDVEGTYHTGVQQFAHGDITGAITALQSAVAADPKHAPSWRALGFVYEKRSDRPHARAAYQHYLQLAPRADDAATIRDRLERLGS
jgi:cytochrome c-type biogenesis protein CcmH/NrfG